MALMVIMNGPPGSSCSVHSIFYGHSFYWSLKESCEKGKPRMGITLSLSTNNLRLREVKGWANGYAVSKHWSRDTESSSSDPKCPSFHCPRLLMEDVDWGGSGMLRLPRTTQPAAALPLVLPPSQCTQLLLNIWCPPTRKQLGPSGFATTVDLSSPTATYLGPPLAPLHFQTPRQSLGATAHWVWCLERLIQPVCPLALGPDV